MDAANFLYSDGDYLYAYGNKRMQANGLIEPPGMYFLCRSCEHDPEALDLAGVDIQDGAQATVLFASVPLSGEHWQALPLKQLVVARDGEMVG